MSAPPVNPPASISASGYEDGFGRRALAFDREGGALLERLYLRPEFSIYESVLRDSFARFAADSNAHIVAPRLLECDRGTGRLVAVSPFVTGERLADLLDAASETARVEGAVPGLEVALGFLLDILPTIGTMRGETEQAHGAIAPSRCVLTMEGRVVLIECGFGPVLQRLNLTRQRLWREFRVAMPPAAGAPRFDTSTDISQAAVMAVMLVLGRPMTDDDTAEVLPELMAEVIEIAQIRSNVTFAINLQRFLQRALPLPGRRPYQTVDAALHDVRQLATGIGVALCQSSLADFVRQTMSAPQPEEPAAASADEWCSIEIAVDAPTLDEAASPVPVLDIQPAVLGDAAESLTVESVPQSIAAGPVEPLPAALERTPFPPAVVEESQPQPAFQSRAARRRRSRALRNAEDTLRSSSAVPVVPELPPAPTPAAASVTDTVPAVATTEPVVTPLPVPPPIVIAAQPVLPQPVFVPQPVFATLPTFVAPAGAVEALWEAQSPAPAAPVPKLAPVAIAPPAPVRLKSGPPAGFAPKTRRYEPRQFSAEHLDSRSGGRSRSKRTSWALATAAALAVVAIGAAGRAYLPDTQSVKAQAKSAQAPVTVTAPPAVATGTIVVQTQPAGARVLLDGSPAGETPLRIVDVAPGRHVLTFITASATMRRTVKVEAGKTLTLDVPVFSGWVAVFAPIVLEISEEGRLLGSTENGRLMLPPGRHTLTLTSREFGYSASHAVDVEAGEVQSLNIQPTGSVNLNAAPWAEVWIDGKKAGDTPLANLQLPLGNREIIFRHPQFGERRVMSRVMAGAPTAVSVDFGK